MGLIIELFCYTLGKPLAENSRKQLTDDERKKEKIEKLEMEYDQRRSQIEELNPSSCACACAFSCSCFIFTNAQLN